MSLQLLDISVQISNKMSYEILGTLERSQGFLWLKNFTIVKNF